MKKNCYIVVLSIFLSSCASLGDLAGLVFTPTPSPPPVDTPTFVPTETPAPTQNLFATSTSTPLTFTPTVTQIGAELFTPTITPTSTNLPTSVISSAFLNNGQLFTPTGKGFLAVLTSSSVFYWNEGPCEPRNVKVSAFVEDITGTHRVLLFTRLREKRNTLQLTDWNSGAIMTKAENGSWTYDLGTDNIRRFIYFKDAWLEYQLVAMSEDQHVIGRTQIYDHNLTLRRCLPVP
jgi:hypothetical protein